MTSSPHRSAVFVDPTGRRRRAARRGAVLLAMPLAGYLVLLVSTLLGGPTVTTPGSWRACDGEDSYLSYSILRRFGESLW